MAAASTPLPMYCREGPQRQLSPLYYMALYGLFVGFNNVDKIEVNRKE